MRRPPITAILTAGACALGVAAPAAAQEGAARDGQRYLAWPGKAQQPDTSSLTNPALQPVVDASPSATSALVTRRRAPIIPHGGFGRLPDTAPSQNLTPASAWLGPNAPTYQPAPPPRVHAPPPDSAPVAPPTAEAPVDAPMPTPTAIAPARAAPWVAAPAPRPAPTRDWNPAPVHAAPSPAPDESGPAFSEAAPSVALPPHNEPAPAPPTPAPASTAVSVPESIVEAAPPPMAVAPVVDIPAPPPAMPTVEAPRPTEPAPITAAPDAPAFDPMAPRRDAPIFRLQRPAPEPAAPAPLPSPETAARQPQTQPQPQAQAQAAPQPLQAAPQEGARYYSLHRQAGRQPDATPLPAAVYLDALPVELDTPPASADLAEPPATPNLARTANGRVRAVPDTEVQDQP